MKAGMLKFFEIDHKSLRLGSVLPFPIYIYLALNDRYAPLCSVDSVYDDVRAQKVVKQIAKKLFVPVSYKNEFEKYIAVPLIIDPTIALGINAIQATNLSAAAKVELMQTVSNEALSKPFDVDSKEDPFISSISAMLEEILQTASVKNKFYLEVLELKKMKKPTDFSLFSTLICLLVSMCQRIGDPHELAPICSAALLRDVGHFDLSDFQLGASRETWPDSFTKSFQKHVNFSVKACENFHEDMPEKITQIISEHHERFDGGGFPNKKWHHQISQEAQIVHLADLLALLVQRKFNGKKFTIPEAIEYIYKESHADEGPKAINPDLIWSVYHKEKKAS